MNIKEEIGQRIHEERKAKGLTRKALAELTDDLKQSRINNWERGIRTPGPEEIKQLAIALDVSPAFLMCLTSEKRPKITPSFGALIPLLDHMQACDPKIHIQALKDVTNIDEVIFVSVSTQMGLHLGEATFALKVKDNSMEPELRLNDILIIDPDKTPTPGCFVVAKIGENNEVIIRRYKQLSAVTTAQEFELLAINDNWADLRNGAEIICSLIGTVCGLLRNFQPSL